MRLRVVLSMVAAVLALLGAAAAAALVVVSGYVERNGALLISSVQGVRAAEELEASLLSMGQAWHLEGSDPENAVKQALPARETAKRLLDELEDYVSTTAERELVQRVRKDVLIALDSQDLPYGARNANLQRAMDATVALIQLNVDQAEQVQAQNLEVNAVGRTVGIAVAVVLVMGVLLSGTVLRVLVDRPLTSLREALARYRSGARQTRLPVTGPTEVRQIAAEFNDLADALARHEQLQLEFLAGVAHDLKNPIGALKLSADAMVLAPALPSEERIRDSMKRISVQSERLARMVDDLLDRTRVEAGNLELQPVTCDVRPLVNDVAEMHRAVSEKHALEVALPEDPVLVRCDAVRFVQVVTNLVSNAIKYSPEGGAIRLELRAGGGEAVVSVADQGVGIAPEELEQIFEPFRRGKGARPKIPGVGLGLSVTRRLVEAHGGRIEVESALGQGSVFRCRFPLSLGTPAAAPSHEPPPASPAH